MTRGPWLPFDGPRMPPPHHEIARRAETPTTTVMPRPQGHINAARLETTERLQRALAALRLRGPHGMTTLDFAPVRIADVPTTIADLRENGCVITCFEEQTTTPGAKAFRYKLRADVLCVIPDELVAEVAAAMQDAA